MSISLYDATVATFIQTTTAVVGFLEKGMAHCAESGKDPELLTDGRLCQDMFPLRFQIVSVRHHSIEAIDGIKAGVFGPPTDQRPHDYAGLQALATQTLDELKALTPDDVEALAEKDVVFQFNTYRMPFIGKDFLQTFSIPNFFFHATTAYDILRSQGAPLGKRDFMGPLRIKA